MENKKYDLEKAKEDCRRHEDALEEAQSCMCGHCHECGFDPSEMKAALDEVERLRSENKIISDRAAHHEKQDAAEIELLAARIKELEAEVEAKQANNEYLQKMTEEAQGIMQESQLLLCKEANEAEQLQNEVERLRSLNESLMENGNDLRTRCQKAEARIKELQDLIDKPPEEADWVADYHLLQSALDGPIIDAARKWHAAYRKAQNSNLMRAKEVKRLRSTPKSGLYGKYIIQKADGSPVDPKADYFILRLDTDQIARRAALEYSYFMASGKDIQLAKDLQARVAKYDPKSEDAVYLRYIGVQKNEVLEQLESTKAEVERLRSENKIISDRAAHHEKQDAAEIELLAARIKELEALNELNHKNMRSWLDTTTDKEFLDKLSSEIGFKDAYIERLEAAFLEATKEIVYATHEGRDAPEGEDVYAEKVARDALEKIKAGGTDESI